LGKTGIDITMIGAGPMPLQVVGQQGFVVSRKIRLERPLDCFTLARRDVDAQFLREIEDVTPGMAITFCELSDQLLDAGRGHGDDPLPFTLPKRHRFAERAFQHRFQVWHK